MSNFITDGAAVLPAVKNDERTPTGAVTNWESADANKLRQALLDVRSYLIGTDLPAPVLGTSWEYTNGAPPGSNNRIQALGNFVIWHFDLYASADSAWSMFAALPSGYWPASELKSPCRVYSNATAVHRSAYLQASTDGKVSLQYIDDGDKLMPATAVYPVPLVNDLIIGTLIYIAA